MTSYQGLGLAFVVDSATETALQTGKIYRFRVSASNILGAGPLSNNVRVAFANIITKPAAPTIDRELSTIDSLFIEWS